MDIKPGKSPLENRWLVKVAYVGALITTGLILIMGILQSLGKIPSP